MVQEQEDALRSVELELALERMGGDGAEARGQFAALRLADGQWVVVQPQPEPFPNSWQKRLLLWFFLSASLPLAGLLLRFAR